jgi:hypothetical protein
MIRYRAVVFLNRFGFWRERRAEALANALSMGEAREDDDGRTYLNPGVRIERYKFHHLPD